MRSLIFFSLGVSVFIIIATLINNYTEVYLVKYGMTAIFYKQYSDLGFYLPTMFLARELL